MNTNTPLTTEKPPESHIEAVRQVIATELAGLSQLMQQLDQQVDIAIELMQQTLANNGKIVVTGIGKNLHIAEKISATLASTGSTSVLLNPAQAMHGDMGILSEGDLLLALSYSGESDELITLIPLVRRRNIKIIVLTGNLNSSLASHADCLLNVAIQREACPFNMAPTTSTTATLAMGDALAITLLSARGFKKEDYAKLHPGGAIGKALLCRVADIMRCGARVATVTLNTSVQDTLLAMTNAHSGSACILDKNNRLKGIFTDGDLRRHIANNILDRPVHEVMTANPISVKAHQLAVDVLQIFEKHDIDDLPVVDEDGALIGEIDIQDLPRLKII